MDAHVAELQRLLTLDAAGRLSSADITPKASLPVVLVQQIAVPVPVPQESPAVATAPSAGGAAAVDGQKSLQQESTKQQHHNEEVQEEEEEEQDIPMTETVAQEIRRLEKTVQELTDTNDRIMAQNIALLADLETAQKAARELKAEKDALAVQLKRALAAAASAGK